MNKLSLTLTNYNYKEFSRSQSEYFRDHRHLTLSDITLPSTMEPIFNSITDLTLDCCSFQTIESFKFLIENCVALKKLKIQPTIYGTICKLVNDDGNLNDLKPNKTLNYLEFKMYPTINDDENAWNLLRAFKMIPMQIEVIHLHLLSLFSVEQAKHFKGILEYVNKNHGSSVQKLTIMDEGDANILPIVLEYICLMDNVRLEDLDLSHLPPEFPKDLWEIFLLKQKKLKNLRMWAPKFLNSMHLELLINCLPCLTCLDLTYGASQMDSVIFNANISKLSKLKELRLKVLQCENIKIPPTLTVLHITFVPHSSFSRCFFRSISFSLELMPQMENLKLTNFYLRYEELQKLATNMPNLKFCDLQPVFGFAICCEILWKNLCHLVLPEWSIDEQALLSIKAAKLQSFRWISSSRRLEVR
jgi:hypothetical protein